MLIFVIFGLVIGVVKHGSFLVFVTGFCVPLFLSSSHFQYHYIRSLLKKASKILFPFSKREYGIVQPSIYLDYTVNSLLENPLFTGVNPRATEHNGYIICA